MQKEKLKKTSTLMKEQNNRGTQYPLFVIQDLKEEITHGDFCDFHKYFGDEGEEIDEKDVCQTCEDKACSDGFSEMDTCECGVKQYLPLKEVWEFDLKAGVFFTEKACDEHIQQNNYHYTKNVRSYVVGAWRNEEMKVVMQSIINLTGDEIPSHYK